MRYGYTDLFRLIVLVAFFIVTMLLLPTTLNATPLIKDPGADVIVYRRAGCPYCIKAETYLKKKNISHELRDIEKNPVFKREYSNLRGRGVPLILFGNEKNIMTGWSEADFNKRYQAFEKEMAEPEKADPAQDGRANGSRNEQAWEEPYEAQEPMVQRKQTQPSTRQPINGNGNWGLGAKPWGNKPGVNVYRMPNRNVQRLLR